MLRSVCCLYYFGGVGHPGPFAFLFQANDNETARQIAAEKCRSLGARIGHRLGAISVQKGSLRKGGEEKLGCVLLQSEVGRFFKAKRAVSFNMRHYV